MAISLDTNVIVRLFVDDDKNQTAAAERCLAGNNTVRISDVAMVETVYVLADWYKLGRQAAKKYMTILLTHPKIECNRTLFESVLAMYVEHQALSIEDCYMAMEAQASKSTPLMTFDKKLANQSPHAQLLDIDRSS